MIDEQVKQHDKFSAEIKVSFAAKKRQRINDFAFNIWIFLPNSLDINRFSYSKKSFYRDLRSNIRLMTPVYLLRDIVWADNSPFKYLTKASENVASLPTSSNSKEFEYHIKMFFSILKSSLRDEVNHIISSKPIDIEYLTTNFVKNAHTIFQRYVQLYQIINTPKIDNRIIDFYSYGEEFMCNVMEKYCYLLLQGIKKIDNALFYKHRDSITDLISFITSHKEIRGYDTAESKKEGGSEHLVYRLGLLKKYVESHLYLNIKKRRDGVLTEQIMYSVAAGISMVFATVIAFSVQQRFGNFTMPLFVALVVSYMLKDRIKEMARYYFAHKMGSRYFDHKIALNINQTDIGWIKESMDFIPGDKVPESILILRKRPAIIDATYGKESEKVMLYRVNMHIDREKLDSISPYFFSGVNSILRLNTKNFIRNMDNPNFMLFTKNSEEGFDRFEGKRVYYINMIIQKQNENQNQLMHYRLVLNRDGIVRVEQG